jgi:DNA repair protein RAD50
VQRLHAQLVALQKKSAAAADVSLERDLRAKRSEVDAAHLALRNAADVARNVAQMQADHDAAAARVGDIAKRRAQLQVQLDAGVEELRKFGGEAEAAEALLLAEVEAAEKQVATLAGCSRAVKQYLQLGGTDRVAAARAAVKALEANIAAADGEVAALTKAINDARRVTDEQHRHVAQLDGHIRALQLREALDVDRALQAERDAALAALRDDKIKDVAGILGEGAGSGATMQQARDLCRNKQGEIEQVRAQHQGSLTMLQRDISERRATLAKDKFREVEKRYASTFIKVQTTEMAVGDIEKYFRALERAVSSYHQEKIAQVNGIIAELWRATYRGSDIDCIEVRSEDDVSSSMARRCYKYRVVMRRGDTELDMRGRCSAGQKVLASVIIRMALSEAFCCDCGILALDEPTTNLDEDNARSLAEALRELISSRRDVRHFQLIAITHDEGFVKALGGADRAESFYFVQKDREGAFSVIEKRKMSELFA